MIQNREMFHELNYYLHLTTLLQAQATTQQCIQATMSHRRGIGISVREPSTSQFLN